MRGLRLHEHLGLVRSSDGRGSEVRRLRKRSDASGRDSARFVARNARRALPEVPIRAPFIVRVLLSGEFQQHGGSVQSRRWRKSSLGAPMREKRISRTQCNLGVPGVPPSRSRAGFTAAGRDAAGRIFRIAQRRAGSPEEVVRARGTPKTSPLSTTRSQSRAKTSAS